MIKDNIKNANNYSDLPERIKVGLNYLINTDFSQVENGKYEISGKEVFAIIQEYTPKSEAEGKFEAHEKYIDIQYVIQGEEKVGVGELKDFEESTQYNEEKDIVFLTPKVKGETNFINLGENEFVILNPNDAHMPSIETNNPIHVKKAVVKVLV